MPVKPKRDAELFAHQLRVALARKGWKAARLAKELGVSRQLAASWTRARALPSGPKAAQLPEILGVTAEWLFPKGATIDVSPPSSPARERSGRSASAIGESPQHAYSAGVDLKPPTSSPVASQALKNAVGTGGALADAGDTRGGDVEPTILQDDEVVELAREAVGRVVRFALAADDLATPQRRAAIAKELEAVGDRFMKLGFTDAAADLYKVVISLGRDPQTGSL